MTTNLKLDCSNIRKGEAYRAWKAGRTVALGRGVKPRRLLSNEVQAMVDHCDHDLRGVDVGGLVLSRIDLSRCDLMYAFLAYTDLRLAHLSTAAFVSAFAEQANFTGACLRQASFAGARLHGADFRGANLFGAYLVGADLSDILWNEDTLGLAPAPEGELVGWGWKSEHLSFSAGKKQCVGGNIYELPCETA